MGVRLANPHGNVELRIFLTSTVDFLFRMATLGREK